MSLTSLSYICFLTVCVFLHYILPKPMRNNFLLLANVSFFAFAMPRELLIMMVYVWIIFILGKKMARTRRTKGYLKFGIILSVMFLFVYKYLNFTLSFFNQKERTFSLIVPIGISYVTFQCIAYLVQIHKRNIRAMANPVDFFNYTLLFTKITAGPIESPEKFIATYRSKRLLKFSNLCWGICFISIGFVKKMVVADMLSAGVAAVFDSPVGKDGLSTILAVIMYAFQIYYDFSGYTDIARGSAMLFGIKLTENFDSPYLATSVVQFWRKWHISLSDWLKNYIYIPLGGSRVSQAKRYRNVFVTFLVSGIWHGASINFIFWGVLHGVFQMGEMLLKPFGEVVRSILHIRENSIIHNVVACVRTFILVAFAWIFFRATNMKLAFLVIKNMFTKWNSLSNALDVCMLDKKMLILIVIAMIFAMFAKKLCAKRSLFTWQVVIISVVSIWLVFASLVFTSGIGVTNSFIYFNF